MIQFENVTKSYGERIIFENVNFKIEIGEKVGVVGRNGTGKTTLVKIMIGAENFDSGTITGIRAEDVGYVEQIPHYATQTLLSEMLLIKNSEEFQARKILFGLGFSEKDLKKRPCDFSGGESVKISLAKALLSEPRVLILDEPTNHLDIYSVEFLENFIKSYRGTVITITHDRHYLQNCVEKILDLDNKNIATYPGNYEKFLRLKRKRWEYEFKAYEKQQAEIAKHENFVARNKVRASTARRAHSRQILLDKLKRFEKPTSNESLFINFKGIGDSANRVMILKGIFFRNLIENFSLEILKGEKVGLIGRNGVGKSTLLKIITGELKSDSGIIKLGNRVKIGYLSQRHENINEELTPIEELVDNFGLTPEQARRELARLNLSAKVVEKPIADLSGGEKTRIAITKLILTGANFLILDEPTNHLDILAQEAIEKALVKFNGTILIVSHDRYLLEKITSRTIELEKLERRNIFKTTTKKDSTNVRRKSTGRRINSSTLSKQCIEKLEEQISKSEVELKMIEHEINNELNYKKLEELAKKHKVKLKEVEELYLQWSEQRF